MLSKIQNAKDQKTYLVQTLSNKWNNLSKYMADFLVQTYIEYKNLISQVHFLQQRMKSSLKITNEQNSLIFHDIFQLKYSENSLASYRKQQKNTQKLKQQVKQQKQFQKLQRKLKRALLSWIYLFIAHKKRWYKQQPKTTQNIQVSPNYINQQYIVFRQPLDINNFFQIQQIHQVEKYNQSYYSIFTLSLFVIKKQKLSDLQSWNFTLNILTVIGKWINKQYQCPRTFSTQNKQQLFYMFLTIDLLKTCIPILTKIQQQYKKYILPQIQKYVQLCLLLKAQQNEHRLQPKASKKYVLSLIKKLKDENPSINVQKIQKNIEFIKIVFKKIINSIRQKRKKEKNQNKTQQQMHIKIQQIWMNQCLKNIKKQSDQKIKHQNEITKIMGNMEEKRILKKGNRKIGKKLQAQEEQSIQTKTKKIRKIKNKKKITKNIKVVFPSQTFRPENILKIDEKPESYIQLKMTED